MQTVGKRSRFTIQRRGVPYRITDTDLALIEPLQTYKYLPSSHIVAFNPQVHPQYVKNRLTVIRHEMGLIDCPASSWHAANARYRPAVYQLTAKGRQLLTARGRARRTYPTSEEFAHEFGSCLVAASFALGATTHPEVNFYDHEAILTSRRCPQETRLSTTPFQIPLIFKYHFVVRGQARHRELETLVKHDWMPFGFVNPARPKAQVFFPGIEFDRHTERLASEDYEATAISKKMQAIRALAAEDGYFEHYGIPNTFIPWITIGEARMRSLMRVVEEITDGKGSAMFLFTHMPDFASFESFPPADDSMLTRNWKRVGHRDFNILRELGLQ